MMIEEVKLKQAQHEANESEEEMLEEAANAEKEEQEKEEKELELEHHFYTSDEKKHAFGFRDGIKITLQRNRVIDHTIELERDALAESRDFTEMREQYKNRDKEKEKELIKEHIRDLLLKKKHPFLTKDLTKENPYN